jgi:hypothetical protein
MTPRRSALALAVVLVAVAAVHVMRYVPTEPFFNNDETRHVMTGVFVRDLLIAMPVRDLRGFTVQYYLQYPALGLLVWPPLFYLVEGLTMLAFGPSLIVAKVVVATFGVIAAIYLFALIKRDFDDVTALVAVTIFALSPLVFAFSRQVMLEVPTLACVLAAFYYFDGYLRTNATRMLSCAAVAAVAAASIRFDAAFIALSFVLMLWLRGQFAVLVRPRVWATAVVAVCLLLPIWALTAYEMGWVHVQSIGQEPPLAKGSFALAVLAFAKVAAYYPLLLPQQMTGWACTAAIVGIVAALGEFRARYATYVALVLGTYLTFTPIGEKESRHVIWWIPAFAVFASTGLSAVARWARLPMARVVLGIALAGAMLWTVAARPAPYVRGYGAAADYVLTHSHARFCLFDSLLNGDFIYQIRLRDPERRMAVLRGDKMLYAVVSNPDAGYREFAQSDEDILGTIYRYDPEYIVVEDPQMLFDMPMANRLLMLLRTRTDRFRLERTFPIESSDAQLRRSELRVYRSLVRNPHPDSAVDMPRFGMPGKIVGGIGDRP